LEVQLGQSFALPTKLSVLNFSLGQRRENLIAGLTCLVTGFYLGYGRSQQPK